MEKPLILLLTLISLTNLRTVVAQEMNSIKLLTLNLHGYHPQGEEPRYLQKQNGEIISTASNIFYFRPVEFSRGNTRRLDYLSADWFKLLPDVIFLQEVGAGGPNNPNKNCQDFFNRFPEDNIYENTAIRLERRLNSLGKHYQNLLACRGNIGWFTGPNQFINERIVTKDGKVIFDFHDNPYPSGILIEGSSIMVSEKINVLDHVIYNDPYNYLGQQFFYQMAALSDKNFNWFLAINIHAGHKINHFEQSILIKKNILKYLNEKRHPGKFLGIILAGDFNARLFNPSTHTPENVSEVSSVFYEVKRNGIFDFLLDGVDDLLKLQSLRSELIKLNESNYKPWASITDPGEFNLRLSNSLDQFSLVQKAYLNGPYKNYLLMNSSLEEANQANLCHIYPEYLGSCSFDNNIDFIMKTSQFRLTSASVLYSRNNWNTLETTSDHPGIFAIVSY